MEDLDPANFLYADDQKSIRPIGQCTVRLKRKGHNIRPSYAIPIVGFLSSLRMCGSDNVLFSGALHQITTGRVCKSNVDQSVPYERIVLKNDRNPISLQERACKETTYPKNEKYVSRSY